MRASVIWPFFSALRWSVTPVWGINPLVGNILAQWLHILGFSPVNPICDCRVCVPKPDLSDGELRLIARVLRPEVSKLEWLYLLGRFPHQAIPGTGEASAAELLPIAVADDPLSELGRDGERIFHDLAQGGGPFKDQAGPGLARPDLYPLVGKVSSLKSENVPAA